MFVKTLAVMHVVVVFTILPSLHHLEKRCKSNPRNEAIDFSICATPVLTLYSVVTGIGIVVVVVVVVIVALVDTQVELQGAANVVYIVRIHENKRI